MGGGLSTARTALLLSYPATPRRSFRLPSPSMRRSLPPNRAPPCCVPSCRPCAPPPARAPMPPEPSSSRTRQPASLRRWPHYSTFAGHSRTAPAKQDFVSKSKRCCRLNLSMVTDLQLDSKHSEIIENKEDACALFDLYKNKQYLLTDYKGKFCVQFILKQVFPKCYCVIMNKVIKILPVVYRLFLKRNLLLKTCSILYSVLTISTGWRNIWASNQVMLPECRPGGTLEVSLDYITFRGSLAMSNMMVQMVAG